MKERGKEREREMSPDLIPRFNPQIIQVPLQRDNTTTRREKLHACIRVRLEIHRGIAIAPRKPAADPAKIREKRPRRIIAPIRVATKHEFSAVIPSSRLLIA